MMKNNMPMVDASSAGRLFDAVGCLLGLGNEHTFDGQIAMSLEQLAYGERGKIKEFIFDGKSLILNRWFRILSVIWATVFLNASWRRHSIAP